MDLPRTVPMPPFARAEELPLDAHGRLAADVPCRKCGYNLRGLSPDGRCPECGTAVGRSVRGDFLQFCDPAWVEQLASGMNWIMVGIALGILMGFASGFAAAATQSGLAYVSVSIATMAAAVISFFGYWKVTTPDPGGLYFDTGDNARKLVRFAQVANLAFTPMLLAEMVFPEWLLAAAMIASSVIGLVGLFAIAIYARRLALRIPNDALANHCRIVMWGYAAVLIIVLLGVLGIIATAAPGTGVGGGAVAFGCVAGTGSLVFGIWALILIIRFRRAFSHAAEDARLTWASGPAPAPAVPAPRL